MEEMRGRWLAKLQESIPAIDMADVMASKDPTVVFDRQNMPEIA